MQLYKVEMITEPINQKFFDDLVELEKLSGGKIKIAVDIEKEHIGFNCELHCDCGDILFENESNPQFIWGANIIPSTKGIEYYSLMNIRPQDQNYKQEITREDIREKVKNIINKLIFQNF